MVKCIAYYGILLGEQRFEQSTVGIEASCIENGVLGVEIFADGILQLLVEVLGATDEANRRHAVAVAVHCPLGCINKALGVRQSQIVVGTEVKNLTIHAVYIYGSALGCSDNTFVLVKTGILYAL